MNKPEQVETVLQDEKQPARKTPTRAPLVTALVAGGIILSAGAGYVGGLMSPNTTGGGGSSVVNFDNVKGDGNAVVTETEQDISALISKVSPGVVSIVTSSLARDSSGYAYQAAGTGMVVTKDGYVMTNKHVVNGASRATVIMSDGTSYKNVPIVGRDPLNDIAFLKISDVNNLTPLEMGDSKTVRTGQNVIAIGNALGQYQNTVTTGIISGLGRPVTASSDSSSDETESLTDLLQTDTAINQGNSGGPLLNVKGQVIGINTAIAADAQGIGFAIPIGAAKGILKHLIATGQVKRAIVGVQYLSINPEVKSKYNLSVNQGDLVTNLSGTDTPAAKAGLKKNDVITKVNDQAVGPGKSVSTLVGEFQPGDKVELTILRDGQTKQVQLTLGAY